jgi:hypothetical protein
MKSGEIKCRLIEALILRKALEMYCMTLGHLSGEQRELAAKTLVTRYRQGRQIDIELAAARKRIRDHQRTQITVATAAYGAE